MTPRTDVAIVEVWTARPPAGAARRILLRVTLAMTAGMTALGVLVPVVPRRLEEVGAGVQALGLILGVAAFTQFVAAPTAGTLGDRIGRRPVLLIGLSAYVVVAGVFLAASSVLPYIAVRGVEGALTAGLFPAAAAIVSDVVPATRRARWVGIVTASYAVGFVVGPLTGGAVYDAGGSAAAFGLAASLAVAGLVVALTVPETQLRPAPRAVRASPRRRRRLPSRRLRVLLSIDFLVLFAFGFIAPQLVFFAYDEAGLTTTQYGLVVAGSALAMAAGQTLLGGLSDRLGRKPIVVAGLFAYAVTFPLYVPLHTATAIVAIASVAGLAFGVVAPALTAFYLDAAADTQRSTILGVRTSVMSAGAFLGPLLLAAVRTWASPTSVFVATGVGLVVPAVVALVALPGAAETATDHRPHVAGTALLGLVTLATSGRAVRRPADSRRPSTTP